MSPKETRERALRKRNSWTPDPEQMALKPEISGNAVNGLGEPRERRPTPVYWQDPETIPHGRMQQWFYERDMIPEIGEIGARRDKVMARPLAPLAAVKRERPAGQWRREIENAALEAGADMIGVARFDAAWVYDNKPVPAFRYAIMLVVEQDYERMSHAPEQLAGAEVLTQYCRAIAAARALAGHIREQGWEAEPHGSPTPATFTMIPAAIAAGIGELGKHGSLINRRYGANFRLSAVLTDLPMTVDAPDTFGVDEFCMSCRVCEEVCPPQALSPDKQMVRGVERWYVDFDRCQPFFNEHLGCSICTTLCPWSQPGVGQNLLRKMAARRARATAPGE